GELLYKKGQIIATPLFFETPNLQGRGRATLTIAQAPLQLHASLASGKIGPWPFQNAMLDLRYNKGVWEFVQNSFQFLNGTVSAKGKVSAAEADLSITAQNVSLSALGGDRRVGFPEGNLNASCAL